MTTPQPPTLDLILPDTWPRPQGYSNALAGRGRLVVLAGQVGWDPQTCAFATTDLADQATQALTNILAILGAAGGQPHHLARLTWYILDRDEYVASRSAIGAAYRNLLGTHYPAMSLVIVKALLEPRAKVEIEATAIIPD